MIKHARSVEEGFKRILSCSVHVTDKGAITLSRLTDRFHDIELAMLIELENYTIAEAQVKMEKVPYDICRETMEGAKKLVGIFIFHPAVVREVRKRIKRKDGCTHLFELIEFTLQTLFSGGPAAGLNSDHNPESAEELPPEEHRHLGINNPRLRNTCRAFVQDE